MAKYIVFKSDSKTGATKFLITTQEKVDNKFVKQWSENIQNAYVFELKEVAKNYAENKKALVGTANIPMLNIGNNDKASEEYWQNRVNNNLEHLEQKKNYDVVEDFVKFQAKNELEKLIVKHTNKLFAWIKSRFGKKN